MNRGNARERQEEEEEEEGEGEAKGVPPDVPDVSKAGSVDKAQYMRAEYQKRDRSSRNGETKRRRERCGLALSVAWLYDSHPASSSLPVLLDADGLFVNVTPPFTVSTSLSP